MCYFVHNENKRFVCQRKKYYLCSRLNNNNMAKVILFARVSTESQSYERQKAELLPLIYADGYSDSDIAIIQYKESAIKNDKDNRESIKRLEELIENEPIEGVYVSEMSRLARRDDVFYHTLEIMTMRNICLIVKNPMYIRTIDKDGKKNPMATVLLAFMQYTATSEMDIKKERMKTGVQQAIKDGKIVASRVKFGYKRDENNRPSINMDETKIVRKIFNMYLNGDSLGVIYNEVKHLTHWRNKVGEHRIYTILTDKTYIGKHEHFPYPPIIDENDFNIVQKRLTENKLVKTKTKNVYYCHGLIKWNNRTFTPANGGVKYTLYVDGKYNCVNMNVMDGLTKNVAFETLSLKKALMSKEERINLSNRLDTTLKKINGINKEIEDLNKESDRINYLFQKGKYSMEQYDYESDQVDDKIKKLKDEHNQLNVTALKIQASLDDDSKVSDQSLNLFVNMHNLTDDNEISSIIHEIVKSIQLEKIENGWNITYEFHDERFNTGVYYRYQKIGNRIKVHVIGLDGDEQDISGSWENRFKRPIRKDRIKH
jgi:DNA invertase Pin-like site-specific DNA recombinase